MFVDAGYLFAEGSVLLTGERQHREHLVLDVPKVVSVLGNAAASVCDARLLRIYWYDAAPRGVATPEQEEIADIPGIKLRLGHVNRQGEQKGVDGLIITDLVELARNRAITDAVLLAGDEDLRVGVVLAQQFGVRVHLVGICDAARSNRSRALMQEADTNRVLWETVEAVEDLLRHEPPLPAADLAADVDAMIRGLDPAERVNLQAMLSRGSTIPQDHDRTLLAIGRRHHDRYTLDEAERDGLRALFRRLIQAPP